MNFTTNVCEIQFGLLDADAIRRMSVAEITTARFSELGVTGSVYDTRMGPMEAGESCITCARKTRECPGHFGHIELEEKIAHPLYSKAIVAYLKCVCIQCSRLLVTEDLLQLWNASSRKLDARFQYLADRLGKLGFCVHCKSLQPKVTFQETEFVAQYKSHGEVAKVALSADDLHRILSNVRDEDVRLLGLDPECTHPRSLVLEVLPVIPPRSRPFIVSDSIICDDDLTIQYTEIVKANTHLRDRTISEVARKKHVQTIAFRIKTMMDNTGGKAKHSNARQMKGIKERLTGKDGLIRNNLMGKRVNFSARSVIGPDPTLRFNEIAIPASFAENLSYPMHVSPRNLDRLQALVWNDGAITVMRGQVRFVMKYALAGEKRYKFRLRVGDIVERKLVDGDIVLLNRQPTLHKGSMLAQRVIIRPGKTIRLNLAVTASFNADFDGDEMNVHTASSEMSRAELELLSASEHNLMGTQASKPIVCVVQDALLGAYFLSRERESLGKAVFQQLQMSIRDIEWETLAARIRRAERVYSCAEDPPALYSGCTLFSLLLPDHFHFRDRKGLEIVNGTLLRGNLCKDHLGSRQQSLLSLLHREYPLEVVTGFLNNVQFLANAFLAYIGFSIGIEDCLSTQRDAINSTIAKCFVEADGIESTSNRPEIVEARLNMALGKAKDAGMKIAKDSLANDNHFVHTIRAGSKGDYLNIAQIMGLVGQQNITGKRVQPHLNKGKRTLPHYPMEITDKPRVYESRGFIRNSFIHGISPEEFWFHAMSGREGITDTAMKTAQSGYIQRKMIKVMEDVQAQYDGTVRNAMGNIIQFSYGGDGMDAAKTVILDGEPHICDISRLAEQLNSSFSA